MGLPHQFYSSTEDISRGLCTVSQVALDQALEGLSPFQQPPSQTLQVLCLQLGALHQKTDHITAPLPTALAWWVCSQCGAVLTHQSPELLHPV